MAGEPVRQFDQQSMQRIADAVRKVERLPVVRQSVPNGRPSPQAREIRWARTTTNYEYPTYPSSGPAYVVEFGDYSVSPDPVYPGATVSKTFVPYDPQVSVIAVDPDNGNHANGSVVRVERDGPQYWIRPAAGAATHPCLFQDVYTMPAMTTTVGIGTSPNYYTLGYYETLGSRTDNHVSRIDLGGNGDPCFSVSQTGAYRITMQVGVTFSGNATLEDTITTSSASAGTAHTHTVAVYQAKQAFAGWLSYLERRVGGSGGWTYLSATIGRQVGVYFYQAGGDSPVVTMSHEFYINLTSGWQLRHIVAPDPAICNSDHRLDLDNAKLLIHYMGESQTADTT